MLRKLFLALFFSVVGVLLHSCSSEACKAEITVSCYHMPDDKQSVPDGQASLSVSTSHWACMGAETHVRLSNLCQRTLQQLFQQWNRLAMKAYCRHEQRMQAVSLFFYRITHSIDHGADVSLYIYRIRHIVI